MAQSHRTTPGVCGVIILDGCQLAGRYLSSNTNVDEVTEDVV
jgi:hypothetical protein